MDGLNFFATLAVYSSPKPLASRSFVRRLSKSTISKATRLCRPACSPPGPSRTATWSSPVLRRPCCNFVRRAQPLPPAAEAALPEALGHGTRQAAPRAHRGEVVDYLAQKSNLPQAAVHQTFDAALGVLDLIDQVTFTQSSGNGQIAWTLHLKPRVP